MRLIDLFEDYSKWPQDNTSRTLPFDDHKAHRGLTAFLKRSLGLTAFLKRSLGHTARINEDEDDDREHFDALHNTSFFGARGAGCIFVARSTGRILLAHRSAAVEQPHTWGGFGGAMNTNETPEEAVRREVHEETGYSGNYELIPLYIFRKGTFSYYNFMVEVEDEFTPQLDWETQGYDWCSWGDWPEPLHFGLISLFNDERSVRTILSVIR